MSMIKKVTVLVNLSIGFSMAAFSQQPTNLDPAKTYINVDIPKTPESAAFQKYGKTEVNEFTGAASVSIPIYTLKSQSLSVPITLNYQMTGIKVNQEASWVGLGWDLMAGGRITVETRGCADFCSSTWGLQSTNTDSAMTQIFNRLGGYNENAVLTPATFWDPPRPPQNLIDTNTYNGYGISEMTEYGTGEPDIFRANFLGHSMTFYVDKITNAINYIGEQTNFIINYTLDGNHNITGWTITDDDGIIYHFNQTETTTNTLPGNAIVPATTTSAWLLTQIVHPNGDYINFTYSTYGYSVPAFNMSGSIDDTLGTSTVSVDQYQNIALQSPYYLTKIETPSAAVNFILNTRTDLYGPGSRELSQITISDKLNNIVKRTITFKYSYFQASADAGIHNYLGTLTYYLPNPLTTSAYLATSNSRLRLDSVYLNDNTMEPPYRFYYNTTVPDKYSYGQDHWGYYNGITNQSNGYSFSHLIPYGGLKGVQNYLPPMGYPFSTSAVGTSRDCDSYDVQAMLLDSIVYPTDGSSGFTFEPHQSTMTPTIPVTGGGVRIKTVRNYSMGSLVHTTNYAYANGKYMGTIHYYTNANVLTYCVGSQFTTPHFKYSSDGAINFNDIPIGYGQVTITEQDSRGQMNGSDIKTFNIDVPSSNYANAAGYDLQPPYFFPTERTTDITGTWTYDKYLDPANKDLPPTPAANLEGKLMQEQFLDNSSNVIRTVSHFYHLANYTNNFYDVRAIQSRQGGFNGSCGGNSPNMGLNSGGERPVDLFVSPAKSYRTLEDSTTDLTYSNGISIKKKTVYQYNSYYQPMYQIEYNSDGTQTITYTQTSAGLAPKYSLSPQGDAVYLQALKSAHVYNLPVEQTTIHRGTAGDSAVIDSRLNIYDRAMPLKVYIAETATPLTLTSQFIPAYYTYTNYPNSPGGSWDSLQKDSHYKLYSTANYSTHNQVRTLYALQGNITYVWDEDYNDLLAQCTNTDSANVAFTSFETNTKGNWTFSGAPVTDATSPTGSRCYSLSSGNLTKSVSSGTKYVVSFWLKSGASVTVSGGTNSVTTGKTINGWTFYEYTVTGATTITVSGSGSIDELRLYPSTSQMISYTYSPLVGMTSMCDADNRISYYFYDTIGRLKWIKDQDGNIIKTIQYHYKGLPGLQY